MNEDVHSALLAQWLKKKIRSHTYYSYKLRLLANCMTYSDYHHGVQILSNGKESKIIGARPCNNSWACPQCTARMMRKYSTRIAAALDALQKQGYAAAMMTLTIFHSATQSCEDSFTLLRKAWEIMDKQKTWRRKKKDGTYYINAGIWSKFNNEFNYKHHVKTLETTYGKHGWHPHIHMLIWVKKEDLQKLADWEENLNTEWSRCIDKAAKWLWGDQSKKYQLRKFLESKTDREDAQHLGFHISKTDEGKIKEWKSGDYLCGWGGDNELTGLGMKVARNDNMSPFQILEKAYELQETDITTSNRLLELYLNFAYTVIKDRIARIAFSRTGLKKIIDNWLQTEEFKTILKKKKESLHIAPFQNIAWFTKEQWSKICCSENTFLIPLILHFAKTPPDSPISAFELINELLIANNLSPSLSNKHPTIDIADCFNQIIAA